MSEINILRFTILILIIVAIFSSISKPSKYIKEQTSCEEKGGIIIAVKETDSYNQHHLCIVKTSIVILK